MSILVVEDEFIVRMYVADILREDGFDVLEAGDASEAIRLLELDNTVEVMITDVNMPGSMDGVDLLVQVRDRWPPVKTIITSGRDKPAVVPEGTLFFPKPIVQSTLTQAVRALRA